MIDRRAHSILARVRRNRCAAKSSTHQTVDGNAPSSEFGESQPAQVQRMVQAADAASRSRRELVLLSTHYDPPLPSSVTRDAPGFDVGAPCASGRPRGESW